MMNELWKTWFGGLTKCFFADEEDSGGGAAAEADTDAVSDDLMEIMDDFDKRLETEGYEEDETDDTDDDKESAPKKEADDEIEVETDDTSESISTDTDKKADDTSGKTDDDEKSVISDELVNRAERLGLDADEARAFKTPESLERVLDAMKGPEKETHDNTDTEKQENPFKFKLDLNKDEYDDHMVDQFDSMNSHYADLFGRMVQTVNSILDQRDTERFDGMVNGLDADWQKVFGKGDEADLDRGSTEFQSRQKLYVAMNEIQQGRAKLGKKPLPARQAFEKALHGEFHKEFKKIEDGKTSKKLKTRKRTMLNRTTSRQSEPLTGDEAALKVSEDFDTLLEQEGLE